MTVVILCVVFQVDLLSQVNMWYFGSGADQCFFVCVCLVTSWIEVGPELQIQTAPPQVKPNTPQIDPLSNLWATSSTSSCKLPVCSPHLFGASPLPLQKLCPL